MPSSKKKASSKKKGKKSKELEFLNHEEECMDKFVREAVKTHMDPKDYADDKYIDDLNQKRIENGVEPLENKADAESSPDIPSCECCDLEYAGTMRCSQCECAFYCSKACQKRAWKELGHKQKCPTMKENAKKLAKEVVDRLNDRELPPQQRVYDLDYNMNDNGPYKFAVEYGLHDSIRQAFLDDKDVLKNHLFQHDVLGMPHFYDLSFTRTIMTCLFRGERISKKHQSFSKVDPSRIQGYLNAYPEDGLQVWWKGSMYMVDVVVCDDFPSQDQFRYHQTLRDILSVWCTTLGSKRVAQLILLTHDPEKCKERATWMLNTMEPYMKKLHERHDLDHNRSMDQYMNILAAIIQIRCKKLGNVDIDAPRVLNLKGKYLAIHRRYYPDMAKAHLKKCDPDYEKILGA